jgi:hypothetical protein
MGTDLNPASEFAVRVVPDDAEQGERGGMTPREALGTA